METPNETISNDHGNWDSLISTDLLRLNAESFKTSPCKVDYVSAGSYSTVRRCYHEDYGTVAAKCYILSRNGDRQNDEKNVVREANILSKLYHNNIVKIVGIATWKNCIAIIMEYVDGKTLQEIIFSEKYPKNKKISLDISLCILRQIACALEYLHCGRQNAVICHCDLKPQNIMITSNFELKLIDIGSANICNAAGATDASILFDSRVDVKKSTQYTLEYADPKFLRNTYGPKFPSLDVYSVSVIIYEMVTRQPAYNGADQRLLRSALERGSERPRLEMFDALEVTFQQKLNKLKFLREMMIRCWDSEPSRRPSSTEILHQTAIQIESCKVSKILGKWKKLLSFFGGNIVIPELARANLTQFRNHFDQVQPGLQNEDGVGKSTKCQKQKINRDQRHSDKPKTKTKQLDMKPHSSTCPGYFCGKDEEQQRIDYLVTFSIGIKHIVQEKTELTSMRSQCEKLLKEINVNFPEKNHYKLTRNCVDITNALIKKCSASQSMFSLALDYIHASTKLNKSLQVEITMIAKRLSNSCFTLAAELRRQHVQVDILPKFFDILLNVKESKAIDSTAKINFCRKVLVEYVRVGAPMCDKDITKWCFETFALLSNVDDDSMHKFRQQLDAINVRK